MKDDSAQRWQSEQIKHQDMMEKHFPLIYNNNGATQVGSLLAQVDLNNIYLRLYDKAVVILLANAVNN
ncbi:hypothetical protein [Shewanella intestini]|uniref:hypothetical protein n=1 Tax=Shewanella sp. XMDDZSB0408 TaxID=2664453 RepID=UPI002B264DC8|nr:hypothetical protein [Shewanella sp. XMDDZSB0408]